MTHTFTFFEIATILATYTHSCRRAYEHILPMLA